MDALPPELLLKIAQNCEYDEICTLSKVDRRWNEVIESNWNSLRNALVESIQVYEYEDELSISCNIRRRDGREKSLSLNVQQGSEIVDAAEILEEYWSDVQLSSYYREPHFVEPTDTEKFLEDILAQIIQSSTIRYLGVDSLRSSTLQVVIALLERFRPKVDKLHIRVGLDAYYDGDANEYWVSSLTDVKELNDAARIVELSKPTKLSFVIADMFTKKEVCEHFLTKIANLYIPHVTISLDNFSKLGYYPSCELNRPIGHGPLPKCRYLICFGDEENDTSALGVPDIVDLVEEWSNNKRDIVLYELNYFLRNINVIAKQFEQMLKERNLPVQFEVVKENKDFSDIFGNFEFLIKKIATRGDKQDELRLYFGYYRYEDYPGVKINRRHNIVVIRTNEDDNLESITLFGRDRCDFAGLLDFLL